MVYKSRKCRLADAMNTYNFALETILGKGYKIVLLPDSREEFLGDFWAIKDERDFIAGDPLRLLGLVLCVLSNVYFYSEFLVRF